MCCHCNEERIASCPEDSVQWLTGGKGDVRSYHLYCRGVEDCCDFEIVAGRLVTNLGMCCFNTLLQLLEPVTNVPTITVAHN